MVELSTTPAPTSGEAAMIPADTSAQDGGVRQRPLSLQELSQMPSYGLNTEQVKTIQNAQLPFSLQEKGIMEVGATPSLGDRFMRSSVFNYYPILRLFGYIASTVWTPATDGIASNIKEAAEKKQNFFGRIPILNRFAPHDSKGMPGFDSKDVWQKNLSEKFAKRDTLSPLKKFFSHFKLSGLYRNEIEEGRENVYSDYKSHAAVKSAKHLVSAAEAFIFAGLTTFFLWKELSGVKENLAGAVGAELGKDPRKVNVIDIMKSHNPVVVAVANRIKLQAVVRYGADTSFLFGLKPGLIAEAFRVTLERSKFIYEKNAYDHLAVLMKEVQGDTLALAPREQLVNGFINTIQRLRRERGQKVMNRDGIDALSGVFSLMAEAALQKKLGMNEASYLLGLGMDEHNPTQSLANVQIVLQHGLTGIFKAKRAGEELKIKVVEENVAPLIRIEERRPSKVVQEILDNGPKQLKPQAKTHGITQTIISSEQPAISGFERS